MDKKKILLSFKPEYFRPLLYNIKKYEYRKRFCQEATTAFLYLSTPVKAVVGIVEFGKPIEIESQLERYKNDGLVYQRIESFMAESIKYAIPIESLRLYKNPITLQKLKQIDSSFFAPQLYLNIENKKTIYDYLQAQELNDYEFINKHDIFYDDNFCLSCEEMEQTDEFKNKENIVIKYKVNGGLF